MPIVRRDFTSPEIDKMTIQKKLYLGFVSSAISVAVVGAFSIHSLSVTAGSLRETIDTTLREVKDTSLAAESAVVLDAKIDEFVDAIDHKQTAEVQAAKGQIANDFRSLADAIGGLRDESDGILKAADNQDEVREEREHIAQIDELDADRAKLQRNWDAICASLEQQGKVDSELIRLNDVENHRLVSKALDLQQGARTEISDTLAETAKSVGVQWFIVVVVGAVAVALTAMIALMTAGPLGRRLYEVRTKASQLGSGDLAARISVEGKDEITDLAGTFNQMAESLATSQMQLVQAADRAEAASHAKSTFLANMSHEIRTPMTAIMGYAERLLERKENFGEHAEGLQIIHRSGRHLLDLINDILDISKIEANKMTVERIEMDLPQVTAEVVSLLRPRAIAQGLALHLTFANTIPRVIHSDPLRVKQILMNVLGNAIKFTERGEVRLRVDCEIKDGSSIVTLEVIDTGIGITREQLARLFQPFTQADDSTTRRFGGTGLGLTISKRLTELLGGDLVVESVANVGSCFRITIDGGPIAGVEMLHGLNESMLVVQSSKPAVSQQFTLNCSILLAEDGPENQKLITLLLSEAGATVTVAKNGRIALDLFQRQQFDLILMDMQMPEMDGYTASSELRKRGCRLPIIALTAHAMSDDRAKCLQAGCTGYVPKPIERKLLLETIAESLGQLGNTISKCVAEPRLVNALPAIANSSSPSQSLRSTLAGEPKYHELIQEYVEGLPAQVERLEAAMRERDIEALRRELHDIRGTAGGLGFRPLTDIAADLGNRAKSACEMVEIESKVRGLIEAIQCVEGFDEQSRHAVEASDGQA